MPFGIDGNIQVLGLNELRSKFKLLGIHVSDKTLFETIGQYLTSAIKMRTLDGKDIEGQPFIDYSPRYEFFRQEKGLPTTPDLFFTGSMLNSMTYKTDVAEESVTVFFGPGTSKGSTVQNSAKAFFNQQTRPFFGMSAANIEKVTSIYREHVWKTLRKRTGQRRRF